eukprot:8372-Chlamydomonas_euryale.AAC.1
MPAATASKGVQPVAPPQGATGDPPQGPATCSPTTGSMQPIENNARGVFCNAHPLVLPPPPTQPPP